jgi:hypothetical protein
VIHVRVRQQHGVNGRKVLNPDARSPQAMNQHQPVRKNRIHEEVQAADLEQK